MTGVRNEALDVARRRITRPFAAVSIGAVTKEDGHRGGADAVYLSAAITAQAGSLNMLTTEPGADVAPFHDRQVVVLKPAD